VGRTDWACVAAWLRELRKALVFFFLMKNNADAGCLWDSIPGGGGGGCAEGEAG
jgi:hypothetical protein